MQEREDNQRAEVELKNSQTGKRSYAEIVKGLGKEKAEERKQQEETSVGETTFVLNIPQNMRAKEAWNYFDKKRNIRDIILPKKKERQERKQIWIHKSR